MADQQGPIYEYMMGTFDMLDALWLNSMNDMLNNFGLAGWKRSVVTLLDARHLLVVMERRFPSAAEYPRSERIAAATREPVAVPDAEVREFLDEFEREGEVAAERAAAPRGDWDASHKITDDDLYDEYDAEGEALMAAKVAEVIPWAQRPKVPANGRRKRRVKKSVAVAGRHKGVTSSG